MILEIYASSFGPNTIDILRIVYGILLFIMISSHIFLLFPYASNGLSAKVELEKIIFCFLEQQSRMFCVLSTLFFNFSSSFFDLNFAARCIIRSDFCI